MNTLIHQLATELVSRGHALPIDVALELQETGFHLNEDSIDGFDVIDPNDVDYFEFIDQNH